MLGELAVREFRIKGYHGLYAGEQKTGNMFRISVRLQLEIRQPVQLNDTVNYERLYNVIRNVFEQREDLIEQVVFRLFDALKEEFPAVIRREVKILKESPLGRAGFDPEFSLSEFQEP